MELLGPYVAATDQIELCLHALVTLLEPAIPDTADNAFALHLEDVLDFLILDKETIPAADNTLGDAVG